MLRNLYSTPLPLVADLPSFRRQESIFVFFNLLLLSLLLCLHSFFASFWGRPSPFHILAIALVFLLKTTELFWLQHLTKPIQPATLLKLTWFSIAANLTLAILLAALTDREDTPYFVLLIVPVLESAFRFNLIAVFGVVTFADISLFWQVWWYFKHHPPLDVGEYFEAGIISVLFAVIAVVIHILVRDLEQKEIGLANNVLELERTREKLLQEERLAAVGQLSSAIAHEIRNPVAMITSSIATAKQMSGAEREEMFEIASQEASRLVQLTTEFLTYARPRTPTPVPTSIPDTLEYVADACKAHASQQGVSIHVDAPVSLAAEVDPGQVQQAVIDLIMNAVDSSAAGSTVALKAFSRNGDVCIQVQNPGEPIPQKTLPRIFEPFFTTKPKGTGLGLAIARNIARAHGGDLLLTENKPGSVCFSLTLRSQQQNN